MVDNWLSWRRNAFSPGNSVMPGPPEMWFSFFSQFHMTHSSASNWDPRINLMKSKERQLLVRGDLQVKKQLTILILQWISLLLQLKVPKFATRKWYPGIPKFVLILMTSRMTQGVTQFAGLGNMVLSRKNTTWEYSVPPYRFSEKNEAIRLQLQDSQLATGNWEPSIMRWIKGAALATLGRALVLLIGHDQVVHGNAKALEWEKEHFCAHGCHVVVCKVQSLMPIGPFGQQIALPAMGSWWMFQDAAEERLLLDFWTEQQNYKPMWELERIATSSSHWLRTSNVSSGR